jgi:hypothetical protein
MDTPPLSEPDFNKTIILINNNSTTNNSNNSTSNSSSSDTYNLAPKFINFSYINGTISSNSA